MGPLWYYHFLIFLDSTYFRTTLKKTNCALWWFLQHKSDSPFIGVISNAYILAFIKISSHILWFSPLTSLISISWTASIILHYICTWYSQISLSYILIEPCYLWTMTCHDMCTSLNVASCKTWITNTKILEKEELLMTFTKRHDVNGRCCNQTNFFCPIIKSCMC